MGVHPLGSLFGLAYNAALETGGVAVGKEVDISLDIEMIKAK